MGPACCLLLSTGITHRLSKSFIRLPKQQYENRPPAPPPASSRLCAAAPRRRNETTRQVATRTGGSSTRLIRSLSSNATYHRDQSSQREEERRRFDNSCNHGGLRRRSIGAGRCRRNRVRDTDPQRQVDFPIFAFRFRSTYLIAERTISCHRRHLPRSPRRTRNRPAETGRNGSSEGEFSPPHSRCPLDSGWA